MLGAIFNNNRASKIADGGWSFIDPRFSILEDESLADEKRRLA
jgi:hypothetical protein